jgi:hypothetical protein
MADLPSKHAVHFEAVKIAMNQTKDGWKLILAVHPNDAPEEVLRALVGARYMIAAVELDEHEQPKPLLSDAEKDVRYAGQLCRTPPFQQWMFLKGFSDAPTEESAARGIRELLVISSRSEIATNENVRRRFRELTQSYLDSG